MMDENATDRSGESAPDDFTPEEKEGIYRTAVWRAWLKFGLYVHGAVYVLVMLLLLVINLRASSGTLWVVWPAGGWGVGLAAHWFIVWRLLPMYESMKQREIAHQLEIQKGR